MQFRYDIPQLQKIIRSFSTLTGIDLEFLDTERRILCKSIKTDDFCSILQRDPALRDRCSAADRFLLQKCSQTGVFEHHVCHAGLYDACMPIIKEHTLAGYVLMGRLRLSPSDSSPYAETDPALKLLYQKVPVFTEEQIASLKILLPEILFQNAIFFDDSMEEITQYVKEHLSEPLSLSLLCRTFHSSKNVLYQKFHSAYGCTVNAYIMNQRMDRAKTLLAESRDSVASIAERVGIPNHSYFNRFFKKSTGITPARWRKAHRKNDSP